MPSLELPPVNRAFDPLLCPHGVAAEFAGPEGEITLSVVCELVLGHDGAHFADGAGHWAHLDDSWPN